MANIKLDEDTDRRIKNLPLVLRLAANMLIDCLSSLIDGKCSEEEVLNAVNTVKDNSNGRYSEDELMNYDKAGTALGFGVTNRNGLKKFLDKNNVKQVKFGATKIGFPRVKIMNLKGKTKKN